MGILLLVFPKSWDCYEGALRKVKVPVTYKSRLLLHISSRILLVILGRIFTSSVLILHYEVLNTSAGCICKNKDEKHCRKIYYTVRALRQKRATESTGSLCPPSKNTRSFDSNSNQV